MKTALLEERLGHRFASPELLERALTHRSRAYEDRDSGSAKRSKEDNETLEFLGDAVLGLAVVEHLYRDNPELPEGDLSLMKHRIVSTETLADVATGLGLGDYLRIGRGEEMTGGREKRAVLADALEAVIGAVFYEAGYVTARSMIERLFGPIYKAATPKGSLDAKTRLQELLQSRQLEAPSYEIRNTDGPPHQREFFVAATWKGGSSEGRGSSIKAAEMMAAEEALKILEKNYPPA
ncbi:MAG TPA: ribonuclease III [Pyrinomonadaceae bacterium]|nr:ribonuclease III [Pyrinomonadaceae bacterium]